MTFKEWIKQFEGQDNVYGDLAEDVGRDSEFPGTDNFEHIDFHLYFMNACHTAKRTFYELWDQYKEGDNKQ